MFAESEWIMIFELASDAGRDVRPFGYPRHVARRPVGLAEPDGSDGTSFDEKDL